MTSEMVDAFANLAQSALGNIHVALPGTIIAYDATGLCRVQPLGKMNRPDGTSMDYPVISGVPVCCPSGIAVPIYAGQTCVLLVCDADIAGWLSGKTAAQSMPHSLQNAVCIPELRKTPHSLQGYANQNKCVAIEGDLYVSGTITSKGNCNAPNIK